MDINYIIEEQERLASRLTYLHNVVASLSKDDIQRHYHTLQHYLAELDKTRKEAIAINKMAQFFIDQVESTDKVAGK